MELQLSECDTVRWLCGWMNAQVCLRVCYARVHTLERRASLDVRLPTNLLLYVRVSLLVPGSGNTPIKAVLHDHVNNFGWNAEAGYVGTAIACDFKIWRNRGRGDKSAKIFSNCLLLLSYVIFIISKYGALVRRWLNWIAVCENLFNNNF